jgi:nitrite reductase/ring-hydroxylating ferredoxin subunit
MTDDTWHVLSGLDPAGPFPAPATVADEEIVVFKTAHGFHAIERYCPHQEADLVKGRLLDNGRAVLCPRHGYIFSLADGKGLNCPSFAAHAFEVVEEGGQLKARPRP